MFKQRPFRFGLGASGAKSRKEWVALAQEAEDLGYSTLSMGDHVSDQFAALPSLLAAAEATTELRVGSLVLANDFRHPAMLARDAATIDVLSEGRLELGIGTGWARADYEQTGIPHDRPGVRVSRFEEAVRIIKALFGPDPVTFSGEYYTINGLNGLPKPLQRPRPPILIGAGGRRMLSIAAREADIVSVAIKTTAEGTLDFATGTAQAYDQKVDWLRQAAGKRLDELELHQLVLFVKVTDDREGAAKQFAKGWNIDDSVISIPQLLEAPWVLIGSKDQIVEDLQARRERFGISYITIHEAEIMNAFAPIVARLSGR